MDRVIFPKGEQRNFIINVEKRLSTSTEALAKIACVTRRSFCNWKNEKGSMPLVSVKALSKAAGIPVPQNIELRDRYWYTKIGAPLGGKATIEKYGGVVVNPTYRTEQWQKWWKKTGKNKEQKILQEKSFFKPKKDEKLAEFVGIMLGDGGIQKRQICITLNGKDEKEYTQYVCELISDLFKIQPSIHFSLKKGWGVSITVSRTGLVRFCNKNLGLKIGHKINQFCNIPPWIMRNKKFQRACLRGLVDTDGCIFTEQHKIKDKTYSYMRLNFTSWSKELLNSAFNIFTNLGYTPVIRRYGKAVQVENKQEICQYFIEVGSNNLKNIKRFSYLSQFQGIN